jgi:hypothetical protein
LTLDRAGDAAVVAIDADSVLSSVWARR